MRNILGYKEDIDWGTVGSYLWTGLLVCAFFFLLPLLVVGWMFYQIAPKDKV